MTAVVYEPETTAFGGPRAMRLAHRLWHLDSHHLLASATLRPRRTRELPLLLCTAMMAAMMFAMPGGHGGHGGHGHK